MPRVGKRYFKYDKMGIKAARKYARKKGLKVHMTLKKRAGKLARPSKKRKMRY